MSKTIKGVFGLFSATTIGLALLLPANATAAPTLDMNVDGNAITWNVRSGGASIETCLFHVTTGHNGDADDPGQDVVSHSMVGVSPGESYSVIVRVPEGEYTAHHTCWDDRLWPQDGEFRNDLTSVNVTTTVQGPAASHRPAPSLASTATGASWLVPATALEGSVYAIKMGTDRSTIDELVTGDIFPDGERTIVIVGGDGAFIRPDVSVEYLMDVQPGVYHAKSARTFDSPWDWDEQITTEVTISPPAPDLPGAGSHSSLLGSLGS